jgi:hypothetical protein
MGRKEVGHLFPPFNQNKGAESLRIMYYMGKRNSCSFPTFIVGSRFGEVTSWLHTEKFENGNFTFPKQSKILQVFKTLLF